MYLFVVYVSNSIVCVATRDANEEIHRYHLDAAIIMTIMLEKKQHVFLVRLSLDSLLSNMQYAKFSFSFFLTCVSPLLLFLHLLLLLRLLLHDACWLKISQL